MATEKRLIDANALVPYLWALFKFFGSLPCSEADKATQRGIKRCIGEIKKMPTVDAVEVVHGRWRYYSTTMQECSNCQRHTARHKFKYCPHCGAIMEDKYHE